MSEQEVFEKIQDIFKDIFDDENLEISYSTNSSHIEDWDSLNHINLIVAIETELNVKFDLEEVATLKDIGAMINMLLAKLNS